MLNKTTICPLTGPTVYRLEDSNKNFGKFNYERIIKYPVSAAAVKTQTCELIWDVKIFYCIKHNIGYTVVYCMAPQGEYIKALMSLVDVKTELLLKFVSQMTHRTQHPVSFFLL